MDIEPHASAVRGTPGRASARTKPAKSERRTLEGVSVLVIEDDVASAKLVAILLRARGCAVHVVASAEEGLGALASTQPDVIILDLVLPFMSGLLFAETVKADPATRGAAIVVVSAWNGRETERLVHAAGCAAYMKKPIDPLTFHEAILRILGSTK